MTNPSLQIGDGNWAYKEDNLLGYAVSPVNNKFLPREMTFTRASDGTRVNEDGLIENVPWNLVEQSETFGTGWSAVRMTITSDSTTAPNGTLTADLVDDGTSTGTHTIERKSSGIAQAQISGSIYAKYIDTQYLILAFYDTNYKEACFDIQNGTLGAKDTAITSTIESVGDGWYRCSIYYDANTRVDPYLSFGLSPTNAAAFYNGTGTNRQAYVWGAQINNGTLKPYFPTTDRQNVPRLTYSGGCPSLLLEPQRTNLFTYSEQFDNSDWQKSAQGSASNPIVTANYAISPDGTQNADRVQFNAGGTTSTDRSRLIQNFSFTTGQVYTISVYAKSTSASNQILQFRVAGAQAGGELIATNEWQRFSVTYTATATTTDNFGIELRGINSENTSDLLLYGMQLEANASYATSYIGPTTSAAVTRVADAAYKTGISSLIGQTEGTIFVEMDFNPYSENRDIIYVGTSAQAYRLVATIGSAIVAGARVSSVSISYVSSSALTAGKLKIGFGYKSGDHVLYINGTQIGTSANTSVPTGTISEVNMQAIINGTLAQGVNQTLLFKTRLTNAELAALTTL